MNGNDIINEFFKGKFAIQQELKELKGLERAAERLGNPSLTRELYAVRNNIENAINTMSGAFVNQVKRR